MLSSEQQRIITGATKTWWDRIVASPNRSSRQHSSAMFCRDFVVARMWLQSEGRLFRSTRLTKSLHEFASGTFNVTRQAPSMSGARLGSDNHGECGRFAGVQNKAALTACP
jgi:hypothetical protein